MRIRPLSALVLAISISLWGCSRGQEPPGPMRSPEQVLQTAQARAEATRQATFQTPPPTPITPSPTVTPQPPTPTLTPTPGEVLAIPNYNAILRAGPDETYGRVDLFLVGQQALVVGRYENTVSGTWWLLERQGEGQDGWVWGGAVTLQGDVSSVPELPLPPR